MPSRLARGDFDARFCYIGGGKRERTMADDDRIYFARRAAEEQERAAEATDPLVASAHQKLQRAYLERASIGGRETRAD